MATILESIPAAHPDLEALRSSHHRLEEMCSTMKTTLEDRRNFEQIRTIRNSLMSGALFVDNIVENLFDEGRRRFVRQGQLVKVCRRDNKLFQV